MEESRYIPLPIRREVRQRCGFGCVICGVPLYEYDHIEQFAKEKKHEAINLTLLCDKHHKEKTVGLLTKEQVIKANTNPFNIINAESTPYLFHFAGNEFSVILGDVKMSLDNVNSIHDQLIPLIVYNKALIAFEIIDGNLFFHLLLYDKTDKLLFKIKENEMVYNPEMWDIEFVGTRLKLREAMGKILFDIEFKMPGTVKLHKANFYYKGYEFIVENGGFRTPQFDVKLGNIVGARLVYGVGKYDKKYRFLFNA